MVGNGDKLRITYLGDKYIGRNLRLKDVFVVPNLKKNLIYVSKFVKDNACSLKFTDEGFIVKDKRTKTILEKGNMRHNMYTLEGNLHESLTATKAEKNSDSIWHQWLGHPHSRASNYLHHNKMIDVESWNKSVSICTSCQMGKSCKSPLSE